MAKFLKGNALNAAIEEIFDDCEKQLLIVSPFIKLHSRFKNSLKAKKELDKLEIKILFGKNEKDISKSINKEDFEFLKEFPNIEISYNEHLHAKYYSDENKAVLSSMNLYEYSQNNNIEFGILTNPSLFSTFTGDSLDDDALEYFQQVVKDSQLLFQKKPKYESNLGGLRKKYITSETLVDNLSSSLIASPKKTKYTKSTTEIEKTHHSGFCIRTGEEIEFNPEKPMSNKAFKMWNKYADKDYPEKYCHFSGEPSNGETSFAKPILKKNWRKAMKK
jgi:hypothetical protein